MNPRLRLALACLALFVASCAFSMKVGPFDAKGARCSWEGDCPEHYRCQFPTAHSHAVCMPGENDLDGYPAAPVIP